MIPQLDQAPALDAPGVIRRRVMNGLLTFNLASDREPDFMTVDSLSGCEERRAPVSYDPAAGSSPSQLIQEILIPSLGSEAMAQCLLDDMAACWMGGELRPFVLALIGADSPVPSQILELMRLMHGQAHCTGVNQRLSALSSNPQRVAYILGQPHYQDPERRLFCMEGARRGVLSGGSGEIIRELVGGDVPGWVDEFAPNPTGGRKVFLFTTPSIPKLATADDAEGWATVLRPYAFRPAPVCSPPVSLPMLLAEEGSALLNRFIDGAMWRIWQRRDGLSPDTPPEMCELLDRMLCHRGCADVRAFITARVTRERGSTILCAKLFDTYAADRKASGQPAGSKDDFTKHALECMKRNFEAGISNSIEGGKGWRGVRLMPFRESNINPTEQDDPS